MSSYTKSTNFASKDSLLTGSPLKVIKGTEIDDEFNSIQTAVNSKADINSPALTGTPTSTTATAGTNTTQIATTAFVKTAIDAIPEVDLSSVYPVGSIYMNAAVSTNPGTLLGFGTWASFGAGRVLVGLDSGDTDFDTVEETGGAKTHTLTVDELPSHRHTVPNSGSQNNSFDSGTTVGNDTTGNSGYTGGDQPHNNLQPYIVVYMWKRTA
jgi:microcystin-dependent protein